MSDAFLRLRCRPGRIDTFVVRRAILHALKRALPELRGTLLDVGCGRSPYRPLFESSGRVDKYLGLDLPVCAYGSAELHWDGRRVPLGAGSVDCAVATELLEHCPEPLAVAAEIRRVLRPGGVLFLTVPFLWPLHDVPGDEFRFTPWSLERLLRRAGFAQVELGALGGYEAALAQMLGLWVRRRSRSWAYTRLARPVLSWLALPAVWALARLDRPEETAFREGQMITGLWALARAPEEPAT